MLGRLPALNERVQLPLASAESVGALDSALLEAAAHCSEDEQRARARLTGVASALLYVAAALYVGSRVVGFYSGHFERFFFESPIYSPLVSANEQLVGFIAGSPLGKLLGLQLEKCAEDDVSIRLPYREDVTTMGDLVHGGAIAALVDTAATAVAWSSVEDATGHRGTTVGFSLNFLEGAHAQDIVARARIVRRGGSITVCEVDVTTPDGTSVARALVTYKLDRPR